MAATRDNNLERLRPLCQEAAARHDVAPEVHEEDFIFRFLINNPVFSNERDAVRYYYNDGAKSAAKLAKLLADLRTDSEQELQLLEFASGYGCVTRHLQRALPRASIMTCDIHAQAVSFIEEQIGITGIPSHSIPEKLRLAKTYDVVFALSFFSHIPRHTWGRWLSSLLAQLKPGGQLIFTAHGNSSLKFLGNPEIPADGFWFQPNSEQGDLAGTEYGTTFTAPTFVFQLMQEKQEEGRIVRFEQAAWWTHQDLYVVETPEGT